MNQEILMFLFGETVTLEENTGRNRFWRNIRNFILNVLSLR